MKIAEIITEPSAIYTNSTIKLKIKIDDPYLLKQNLSTEDGIILITEDNKTLITEWGI